MQLKTLNLFVSSLHPSTAHSFDTNRQCQRVTLCKAQRGYADLVNFAYDAVVVLIVVICLHSAVSLSVIIYAKSIENCHDYSRYRANNVIFVNTKVQLFAN